MEKKLSITREEFDEAVDAIWREIQYQDSLPRRTNSEARDVPGFATLGRRYLRHLEDAWADNAGNELALPHLRKLSAIFLRGMIYCGISQRT